MTRGELCALDLVDLQSGNQITEKNPRTAQCTQPSRLFTSPLATEPWVCFYTTGSSLKTS